MANFMRLAWASEGSPAAAGVVDFQVTMFKGLRVRIGMHSGVQEVDVERNATSGRVHFGGVPLALARSSEMRALGACMGEHLKDDLGSMCVYQAIERSRVPRLAVFEPLRGLSERQAGGMDAPIGTVAIAFASIVGLATLQAWDKDQADVALDVYAVVLKQLLHDVGGYLVNLSSSGQCIAAFHHPLDAVAWGAGLIEVMKHHQWGEELLGHELCEEVFLHEPDGESTDGSTMPHRHVVLFRGPRIKIGIDVGKVQADVAPLTGRMSYHGKVLNRAARISSKASSGKQWCSAAAWEQAKERKGTRLLSAGNRGTQLGAFSLKGVAKDVKLVECSWRHGDDAAAADGNTATFSPHSLPLSSVAPMGTTFQPNDALPTVMRELVHTQPWQLPDHMASMAAGGGVPLLTPPAVSEAQLRSGELDQQHSSGAAVVDSHPDVNFGPVPPSDSASEFSPAAGPKRAFEQVRSL
ncbi:hypothetical protein FOA52_006828 [Chlamydomonas sp. UWO 241]|nr:hypothetical protein FOA52_006828 [Chlamydomonas sp. UWO 241]